MYTLCYFYVYLEDQIFHAGIKVNVACTYVTVCNSPLYFLKKKKLRTLNISLHQYKLWKILLLNLLTIIIRRKKCTLMAEL